MVKSSIPSWEQRAALWRSRKKRNQHSFKTGMTKEKAEKASVSPKSNKKVQARSLTAARDSRRSHRGRRRIESEYVGLQKGSRHKTSSIKSPQCPSLYRGFLQPVWGACTRPQLASCADASSSIPSMTLSSFQLHCMTSNYAPQGRIRPWDSPKMCCWVL